jgi:hypothetical protein
MEIQITSITLLKESQIPYMLSSLMKNTYLNMSSKFMKYPKALNECESHISMTLDT